jgi:hypothetical protein
LLWLMLACGPGPELDQPNAPPTWPMENVLKASAVDALTPLKPEPKPAAAPAAQADELAAGEPQVEPEEEAAPKASEPGAQE